MRLRTLTALAGLAVLAGALWLGQPWVALLVFLAATLALREFYLLYPPYSRPSSPTPATPPSRSRETCRDRALDSTKEPPPAAPDDVVEGGQALVSSAEPAETAGAPSSEISAPGPVEAEARARPLPFWLGAAWAIALVAGGLIADGLLQFWVISLGISFLGGVAALSWLAAFYRSARWPVAGAYLVAGPLYVGFLLAHVGLLAQAGGYDGYALGRNWLIFALLVTFATDTGAYLVGRAAGRHPLVPSVSPNKTWEGAIGGFVGAVIAATLLGRFLDLGPGISVGLAAWNWQTPFIGATVGVAAQLGDLLESKLKRLSQVKDSGRLMPGHGGILDRLDSLLVTLPVVYYLAVVLVGL